MNFKKILLLILTICLMVTVFTACKKGDSSGESSSFDSTEEITTAAPDYSQMQLIATGRALSKDLGIIVKEYTNSNPYIVDVEISRNALLFYGYTPGTATLDLVDYFGHTARVTVTVTEGERKIDVAIEKCKDEFIEVSQFGATGNGTDDTAAFQKALDSAKPGETVYVYPGVYTFNSLIMREGVTLKLYTEMEDATQGFTDKIAEDVKNQKYAILVKSSILNNDKQSSSDKAASNFTISGGVFDAEHTGYGFTFGRGDNIRLENIIFKDGTNNHFIQITGCTNSVIQNCMFAGFECGDAFTREVVQVEPSHSGAGSLKFEEGEFYYCENITIDHCYFGESDELGAPLMAIGHHWYNGKANVSGFRITNNVFDECLYAAIRYSSIIDTEISGNTFISTSKYMNATQYTEATTPSFILLYHPTSSTKYVASNGSTVIRTTAEAQDGFNNLKIENNTFTLEKGSDKRIIYIVNSNYTPGASFNYIKTQDAFDSPVYDYAGYIVNKNYARNISFSNNTININGQPTYNNYYIKLTKIYNLKFEGNKYNIADGVNFTITSKDYQKGHQISSTSLTDSLSYIINVKSTDKTITVNFGDKSFKFSTTFGGAITLKKGAGGSIEAETDGNGNLIINVIPADNYTFGAFTDSSSKTPASSSTVNSSSTFNITFKKK